MNQQEEIMGQALPPMDRRRHYRCACALNVDLDDYEHAYSGCLSNLGLGGAQIKTPEDARFHVGQELFLTIPFQHKEDYLIIKGRIAWCRNRDIGVAFIRETPFH
jgi:Tfp pilus assembly protein PilZ